MKKAVARLRELGLWRKEYIRDKDGLMCGSVIILREDIDIVVADYRRDRNPSLRGSNSSDISPLPNTNKNLKNKKRSENNNNPALPVNPTQQRLNFITLFGLEWSDSYSIYLSEERVCSILKKYGVSDPAQVRRIVAEWSGMIARGLKNTDASASLVWLCQQKELPASKEGDELMLPFA